MEHKHRRRKCLCCKKWFATDPRNHHHQRFCTRARCRKASKILSQKQWLRPSLLPNVLGIVEQTSRGIAKLLEAIGHDKSCIQIPIVSVPDSTLKKDFEPPFIADGILLALTNLISRPLRQMKILVLGHGVIGKALVCRLVEAGAQVTVYDPKLIGHPASLYARFKVAASPVAEAANKDLIIGASGKESITREVINAASDGTCLASASSDQNEIAMAQGNPPTWLFLLSRRQKARAEGNHIPRAAGRA